MDKINNIYNFKNTVRFFIDIENLYLKEDLLISDISDNPFKNKTDLCWTDPFKFRVRKSDEKYRVLKIPNILNFLRAYIDYKDMPNFEDVNLFDPKYKRMSVNLETGEFKSGIFQEYLNKDFLNLCNYDYLLRLDIKDYYNRIYTHNLMSICDISNINESSLTSMNSGATNGLLMGNYLSLYFAEMYSKKISNTFEQKLEEKNIICEYSYFSDDFYIYCNKHDINEIIKIFDLTLEEFDLERNDSKVELWEYLDFNEYNLVGRYWNKTIGLSNKKFHDDRYDNSLFFLNQLIYRASKLQDYKLRKVFINNFFKSNYFQELNMEYFKMREYNYHQLLYIYKEYPESILYSITKFLEIENFEIERLSKFLEIRYSESLKYNFNEEQLYYYMALNLIGLEEFLKSKSEIVSKSGNQVLISYYLKNHYFNDENIKDLKDYKEEEFWFQNYHLLLYSYEESIDAMIYEYLIPNEAKKYPDKVNNEKQIKNYSDFYKSNIIRNKKFIVDEREIFNKIDEYVALKIQENKKVYKEKTDN